MVSRKKVAVLLILVLLVSVVATACGPKDQAQGGKSPFKFTLYAYTNPRPYNPVGPRLAEAIQAELNKIGVEVEIKSLAWKEYKEAILKKDEGDAFLFGWIGDNGDPDNFLYVHFHSSQSTALNSAHYNNPTVDKLLEDAQKISDTVERAKLYKLAQEILLQEAPWIYMSWAKDLAATRTSVSGHNIHPTGMVNLRPVDISGATGEKVLIYARGSDSISLDPALIDDGESAKVVNQVYEGLLTYKPGNTEIQPALATEWAVSQDGKEYTFKLRQGVKFHDGSPLNASAVKFSIERQMPPNDITNMPYADFSFGMIEKIDAIDDSTVKFTLKYPYSPFLANLAMGLAAPIVSPKAVEKYKGDFGTNPVGTGPFIFEKWDKEQQIVLKANPNYWGGKPKLGKVIFKVVKENSVRADELIAGTVHIIDGVDPNDMERLKKADGVKFMSAPGMNINYLAFRTNRPPFDNVKLRQAVSMAVGKVGMVDALYRGIGVPANGPLPPGLVGYDSSLKPIGYDPDGAKKILQELGYSTK